jgi:putative transposase
MPHLAHIIALRPTTEQIQQFRCAAGCARFAYNWGLSRWKERYKAGGKPNWMSLQREFVSRIDAEFPFMRAVPSSAYYQAFRHLGNAYSRFFKKLADYPQFKLKHGSSTSFKLVDVRCHDQSIVIPCIGAVRCREALRLPGRIISATVRLDADRWVISVLVDVPAEIHHCQHEAVTPVVGIDLGLKVAATFSDGTQVFAPKPLKRNLKRLRRCQRRLSRCQKGSKRRCRARTKVARLHRRIRSIRQSFLHPLTTRIVQNHGTIVIEDLHVKGMLKNHSLARAISDVGWGEFRRQLTYKSKRYGRNLLLAPRFFPSSKQCSHCGCVKKTLSLQERVFDGEACGLHLDRDHNAARNLAQLHTAAEAGINALREIGNVTPPVVARPAS